jgi:hypothetical protein
MLPRAPPLVKLTIEIVKLNNEIRFQLQKGWRVYGVGGGLRGVMNLRAASNERPPSAALTSGGE